MLKNSKKNLFKSFLFIFLIFGFGSFVYSQTLPGINLPQSDFNTLNINFPKEYYFDISVSNENPFPNEEITAKIQEANFDIRRSHITWTLNGKTLLKGRSEDEFNFVAGKLGSLANLTVSVITPDEKKVQKSIILRPADIDILWQADTYAPYFYKGKSLASPQSKVTVAAIPHFVYQGDRITPENLFFKWYLNDRLRKKGWGKDSFNFETWFFAGDQYKILVEISSLTEILIQKKSSEIITKNPEIIFYEYNPFEGVKAQRAVSSFKARSGEYFQFIAEPYFTPNDKLRELTYKWEVNGKELKRTKPFNMLNFSSEAGASGSAFVNLTINFKNLVEKINNSFNIQIR